MKIAFVSQPWDNMVPPVQAGSIAIWTYEVARRLAPSYDVVVFARGSRHGPRRRTDQRVQYRYIWTGPDVRALKLHTKLQRFTKLGLPAFASPFYYLPYIIRAAWELRKQNCDVIHVHNFSQFVPVIRAFNPRATILLHMHCEWLTQLNRSSIRRRLRSANGVLGCSDYITNKIRACFPEHAGKCGTVFNGVDLQRFLERGSPGVPRRRGTQRLLFVGRISPEKGLHVLLEAFAQVQEEHPGAVLDVIGPAGMLSPEMLRTLTDDPRVACLKTFAGCDYLAELQKCITSETIERVRFLGQVPHEKLVYHFRDADVFISPSLSDSFPLTVTEAMASGLPVVATRVGGIPEAVVDNETGVLIEPNDVNGLAREINRLLDDSARMETMGKAARRRVVERFSWEKIAESLLERYRNACAENA